MDVWSVGCVIYELFTGRILFPGRTNNEMLKLMMDVKGPFPKRMLKAGAFTDKHFESDPNMSFGLLEEDAVTKRPVSTAVMGQHDGWDWGRPRPVWPGRFDLYCAGIGINRPC